MKFFHIAFIGVQRGFFLRPLSRLALLQLVQQTLRAGLAAEAQEVLALFSFARIAALIFENWRPRGAEIAKLGGIAHERIKAGETYLVSHDYSPAGTWSRLSSERTLRPRPLYSFAPLRKMGTAGVQL